MKVLLWVACDGTVGVVVVDQHSSEGERSSVVTEPLLTVSAPPEYLFLLPWIREDR